MQTINQEWTWQDSDYFRVLQNNAQQKLMFFFSKWFKKLPNSDYWHPVTQRNHLDIITVFCDEKRKHQKIVQETLGIAKPMYYVYIALCTVMRKDSSTLIQDKGWIKTVKFSIYWRTSKCLRCLDNLIFKWKDLFTNSELNSTRL